MLQQPCNESVIAKKCEHQHLLFHEYLHCELKLTKFANEIEPKLALLTTFRLFRTQVRIRWIQN